MDPITLRDLLCVPRLKKNLISVSMIEDRGLGVYFHDRNVHVFPKGSGPSTSFVVGFRCGKLQISCFNIFML